jgi:hypothetical protein
MIFSSSFSSSSSSSILATRTTRRRNVIAEVLACILILVAPMNVATAATNELSGAEIEGRELVRQILDLRPAENFTNTGVLHIRDGKGNRTTTPIRCDVVVTATNWFSVYQMLGTNAGVSKLLVAHDTPGSNRYQLTFNFGGDPPRQWTKDKSDVVARLGFAGDFSVADLGLEFFHWTAQKVLKHEMKRGQACKVLESTNPEPPANGYSHVVSWIDNDTLGIVQAEAFDAKGKLLKEFAPKEFKKVNGQWQLQEMEIRNVQTGSRTRLEFNLENR